MCIFNKLKVEKIHHFFPLFRLFKKNEFLIWYCRTRLCLHRGAKLNTCRTLKYSCNSPIPTYSSNISPSRSPPVPPPRSMLVKYTLKTTSRNDHFLINLLIHFLIRNWGKFATIFTKILHSILRQSWSKLLKHFIQLYNRLTEWTQIDIMEIINDVACPAYISKECDISPPRSPSPFNVG